MGMRIPSVRGATRPDPPPPGVDRLRERGRPPLYSSIIGKIQHTTLLLPVLPISTAKYPLRTAGDGRPPYRCFGGCCTIYILRRSVSRSWKRGKSGVPTGSSPSREKGVAPVGIARFLRAPPGRHPPHVTGSNMRMSAPVTCACEPP